MATVTYTVKSGDTLSKIAAQFGVSVATITAANGITNPNLVMTGQPLTIPDTGGRIIDGTTGEVVSTSTPAPSQDTALDLGIDLHALLQHWIQPPRVYYAVAAALVGAYFWFSKKGEKN